MERSRRKRLSELYGEPVIQRSTPSILRQRSARDQQPTAIKKEHKQHIHNTLPKDTLLQPQSLIPPTLLDIGSQRAFAVALFTIIQSYKIYDLILLKNNLPVPTFLGFPSQHFNFIVKYILYDSAFLYFLPAFRIPSLNFKKTTVILQIILLLIINLFLASDLSFPLTAILLQAWKQLNTRDLTVLGSSSRSESYDPSKHFKGSHTIKILPENTAFLNPFGDSFCLPAGTRNFKVNVPIRFNSTSEIDFMQIKFVDLETNVPILLNYTKKDIKKFEAHNINSYYERDSVSGPNIHYLNLPVSQTGLYEISQVLDSKYLGLRNYRSSLVVPTCPTAEINNLESLPNDRCYGDIDVAKFTITGVPPLKLKYKKLINQKVLEFNDQSLQPEFFKSPLLGHSSTRSLSKEYLNNIEWAKSIPVEVELENVIKELGDYSYRIEEIVDGLGNLVNFTQTLKNDDNLFQSYNLLHSFFVHDSPKLHLSEKVNLNAPTKKSIHLDIDSNSLNAAPFEAKIKFVSEDETESSVFTHVFKDASQELPVSKPGTYSLESVNTKYCPAIITGRSTVSISLPVVPQLQVNSKPITDSCVGQVGLVFDFSFVGTPPFTLEQSIYRIENDEKKLLTTKRLVSQGTRFRFSYEPSSEGNYEISFNSLKDSLYLEPIQLSPVPDYTYKTSMRVKPSAEINNYQKGGSLCLGSQGKVPIQFKGEAPFSLDYDIIETLTNKRTPYSVKDIKSNRYEIVTPGFKAGGEYIVSLTAVEDSSGCLVNLNGADAKIAVRREVPSIGFGPFDGSTKIKVKEGDRVELPVRLLGEGSFDVTYDYLDPNGNHVSSHHKSFRNAQKASIDVNKAGFYKLKSVKDSLCSGTVDKSDTYEVTYHPKPSLAVNEQSKLTRLDENQFEKSRVCQYHEDSIDLSLYGAPPFVVDYTIVAPNGQRTSKSISVATRFASIVLPNDKGGEYKYIINGIYDAIYSKVDLSKIRYSIDDIVVQQTINPSPRGEFKDKRKSYRTCTTNLLDDKLLDPIKLELKGNAPYTVTFEIFHESSSKSDFLTLKNIENSAGLKDLYRGLNLGNHIVNIVKIVDADGCVQEDFQESNYVSISITDTPKINQLDSTTNYCVGDHVGYQLIGTSPFTVVYSFNGIDLKSVEHSSQFVRLASEPGTISISSLQDSSSNCVVNFTLPENKNLGDKLAIAIHPIPSVEVSEGDFIVQDIHEGDQAEIIFSFEGTPPFSLTYVRTEEVEVRRGKKRSQVVETHTVNGIYAYEYRVLTSLQGTYEAIEVSDAFCVARNENKK